MKRNFRENICYLIYISKYKSSQYVDTESQFSEKNSKGPFVSIRPPESFLKV